jgi:hypothetical protein
MKGNVMINIKYVKGDATKPVDTDPKTNKIIIHCCNDIGAWGDIKQ